MPQGPQDPDFTKREYISRSLGASPRGQYMPNASRHTRQYLVDWDDIEDLRWQIAGRSWHEGDGAARQLKRHLPMVDPASPFLVATGISDYHGRTIPDASADGDPTHIMMKEYEDGWAARYGEKALITVEFEHADYIIKEDGDVEVDDDTNLRKEFRRHCSVEYLPASEYTSTPTGFMIFSEGPRQNQKYPQGQGFSFITMEMHVTWRQVKPSNDLWSRLLNRQNTVNAKTISIPDIDGTENEFTRHQMLYKTFHPIRHKSGHGEMLWDFKLIFGIKITGWTNFFDHISRDWYQTSTDGTFYPISGSTAVPDGKLFFDEYDFAKLFQVADES